MRREHLTALAPRCPLCRSRLEQESPLALGEVFATWREEGAIREGILRCTEAACQREYPVLDGVPWLLADLRSHLSSHLLTLLGREDLSPEMESLLGDCAGPGSAFDTARQQLSAYAWDHYGDLDPEEEGAEGAPGERPGTARRLLAAGLALAGEIPPGPVLDLGCAAGRTTLDLAHRLGRTTLGVDLHPAFLRLAAGVLARGEVRYPRRRVGLVYDRRAFPVRLPGRERVDFWAADAASLPFPPGLFALVVSLNVLDCVTSPRDALAAVAAALAPGGKGILATPYDWSPAATPVEAWLGGHSQRGPGRGEGSAVLRALLGGDHPAAVGGLRLVAEEEALPWRVRLHDRAVTEYRVHLVAVERTASPSAPSA